jgi:hypothetical protein
VRFSAMVRGRPARAARWPAACDSQADFVGLSHGLPRADVAAPVLDSCLVPDDRRNLSGYPATACRAVPVTFSAFLTSLRIPNPETTSATPRMTSQTPTTRASVTIESNG